MTTPDPLNHLRHLCHDTPDGWGELCRTLQGIAEGNPDLLPVALEYAAGHLDHWPDPSRDANARDVTRAAPHWTLARYLDLGQARCTPEVIQNLLARTDLAHFTILDLTQNRLSAHDLRSLIEHPPLRGVVHLLARSNPLGHEAGDVLGDAAGLARLTHLDLTSTRLTDAAIPRLADNPHLTRLTTLDVSDNAITDAVDLFNAPYMTQLAHLGLKFNPLAQRTLDALTHSVRFPQLQTLLLRGCRLHDAALVSIARALSSPTPCALQHLDLAYNPIDDAGLEALLESPHAARLKVLNVQNCPHTKKGQQMLARFATKGVRVLV